MVPIYVQTLAETIAEEGLFLRQEGGAGGGIPCHCFFSGAAHVVGHVHVLLEQSNNIKTNKTNESGHHTGHRYCGAMLLGPSATLWLQKYNKILVSLAPNWALDPLGPPRSPNSGLSDKCNVVNVTIGMGAGAPGSGCGLGQGTWAQGRGGLAGHKVQGGMKGNLARYARYRDLLGCPESLGSLQMVMGFISRGWE